GSSFKAIADKDFLTTSDGWFRPISEQVGPDGALWVGDWCDKYPCYQNAQADPEGVDRGRGRIWRWVYTWKEAGKKVTSRPEPAMDLEKLSNAQLIKILEHPNEWQRRMAQRLLSERRAAGIRNVYAETDTALRELIFTAKQPETQLAALSIARFW